jgi:hypothetical protein
MARRINEVEIGEQLSAQKIWMRENSQRNPKSPLGNKFGLVFIMVGILITTLMLILGEYVMLGLGVALIGLGTVVINR